MQQSMAAVVPMVKRWDTSKDSINHSETINRSFVIPRQELVTSSNMSQPSKGPTPRLARMLFGSGLSELVDARAQVAATGVREDHSGEAPLQDLMQMSADVYQLWYKGGIVAKPPHGWSIDRQMRNVHGIIKDALLASMAVYTKWPLAVFVFKGTSVLNTGDDLQDVVNIASGSPPTETMVKAAKIIADYQKRGYTVMTTGHSLGGYLAEIVATTIGLAGAGFCAIGPGWHDGFKGGHLSGFRNINFRVDPLGNYAPVPGYGHAQIPIYVYDCGIIAHHHYEIMLRAMRMRGRSWTNQNAHCHCGHQGSDGYHTFVSGVSCTVSPFDGLTHNSDTEGAEFRDRMWQSLRPSTLSLDMIAVALVGAAACAFTRCSARHVIRHGLRSNPEAAVRLLSDA